MKMATDMKCSSKLVQGEIKIKATMRYYPPLLKSLWWLLSKIGIDKWWQGCQGKGTLVHC
jgi:hypothetical protein